MSQLGYKYYYRRHLPHFQPPGATLFVTFRLVNSIPKDVCQTFESGKISFEQWDQVLDKSSTGHLWLSKPKVARLVYESLVYRHKKVYDLDTFTIMSNHVHIILTPLKEEETGKYYALQKILHSLKRYTARNANTILNRKGQFWQHENYDHVIRNENELKRLQEYILQNPVKAGLVENWQDWEWSYIQTS